MSLRPVTPQPSVHLREATEHDVGFLTDVVVVTARAQGRLSEDFDEEEYRAGFTEWTLEQVRPDRPAELEHSTTYVVEIDGERAGRLRVVREPDHRELAGIQLLPAHQGKGIGTHLVEQFLVEARDLGLPARVVVENDNPRARALYERLGFVELRRSEDETWLEAR